MADPIAAALLGKILEQIERTEHLMEALPDGAMQWSPPMERPWTTARLLGHLVTCLTGFCAVLYAVEPEKLEYFASLRTLPPVPEADLAAIRERFQLLTTHIVAGFEVIGDSVLAKRIPTVFVPGGEPVITLLLGNLEHLVNHKHQLFTYLRLLNVGVESQDLYRFRS